MLDTSRPRSTSACVRTVSATSRPERLTADLLRARRIMLARMCGPPDLALHQAGVFGEDADADLRGQQAEVEGATLAAHFEVALAEDEAGPDEAAVGSDLLGAEQEPADALRRPLGRALAGRGGELPQ